MSAILLIGSGIGGLTAALLALWFEGGLFIAALCYAIFGNLCFSFLTWLYSVDIRLRERGLSEEIASDLQALLEHNIRTRQEFSDEGLKQIFPEVKKQKQNEMV